MAGYATLFVLILELLLSICQGQFTVSNSSDRVQLESQVLTSILNGYDSRVRPLAKNGSYAVRVNIAYSLLRINQLSEKEEYIDTSAYLNFHWWDHRLQWNDSYADGKPMTMLRIPIAQMWRPDIHPYNNFEHDFSQADTMAVVLSVGTVMWMPPVRIKSSCQVDLYKFPYDIQTCTIDLGSWTYTGHEIELTTTTNHHMTDYQGNKEWVIISSSSNISTLYYVCCPEPYQTFKFSISLRRNSVYYTHVFVLPAVLLAFLVPFHFLLPPDSHQRITLASVLLLSLVILLSLLQDVLPNSHNTIPAIGMYYSITFVWITLSMICSIWIMNIRYRGPRKTKVPHLLREIFLKGLKKLVCLGDDAYYSLDEIEAISMRGMEQKHYMSPDSFVKAPEQPPNRLERDVDELLRQVHAMAVRQTIKEARNEVLSEWHQVALVLDRVLCFFFFVSFLIYTFVLLV